MRIHKINYLFSAIHHSIPEYISAQEYFSKGKYEQSHEMFKRVIDIMKSYKIERDVLQSAYKCAKQLGPIQENEILGYSLTQEDNVLQYIKNLLIINPKIGSQIIEQNDRKFTKEYHIFQLRELSLYTQLLLGDNRDNQDIIEDLIRYSEGNTTLKQRLLFDIAMNSWLSQSIRFCPILLNNSLTTEVKQTIIDNFQCVAAKSNVMPKNLTLRMYKAYADFIMSSSVQLQNKTIVGNVLQQYLKYVEKHFPNQVYLPLLSLGWLNLQEQKYMVAEGLFRTIEDQFSTKPNSLELLIQKGQFYHQNSLLLSKLSKRETEIKNMQDLVKNIKISNSTQVAALYFNYMDYDVQF